MQQLGPVPKYVFFGFVGKQSDFSLFNSGVQTAKGGFMSSKGRSSTKAREFVRFLLLIGLGKGG